LTKAPADIKDIRTDVPMILLDGYCLK